MTSSVAVAFGIGSRPIRWWSPADAHAPGEQRAAPR